MAIHKRGKQGFYSAYFRGLDERPDGTLVAVRREVNLHTSDARTAAALDMQLREREAKHRAELRARAFARQLMAPDVSMPVSAVTPARNERPRRLRLADALACAAKYGDVGDTARKVWTKFARSIDAVYMDQVTAEEIHDYLRQYARGHTANNVRGVIGRIFKLTRMDSGRSGSAAEERQRAPAPDHGGGVHPAVPRRSGSVEDSVPDRLAHGAPGTGGGGVPVE